MNETPEEQLLNLDWTSLTEAERTEFIIRQATYIELTRKFIHATAVHAADVRNIFLSLLLVLILLIFQTDIKFVIMAIFTVQTLFTISSKATAFSVQKQLSVLRDSYLQFLKEKSNKKT
jgi:hypothetical protein